MSTTTTLDTVELGRYLTIAARRIDAGQTAPEMFSAALDAAWHAMLGTPEYAALSTEAAGRVFAHQESPGSGPVAWVSAYEEAYGPLPEIWFADAHGAVNTTALAHYRETGTVYASWNCGPADGDYAPAEHAVSGE